MVYAPEANSDSVAEHATALMLALAKRLCWRDAQVKAGNWTAAQPHLGLEVLGKTVGIVGLGRIGRRVARICHYGLGMKVIAFDPAVSPQAAGEVGAELVGSLVDLLPVADFVTLHLPLIATTRGLIGERELALMKPTAYLINVARGPLVEQGALVRALAEGRLAGAGLDVVDPEPPDPNHPLFSLPNVLITPHCAGRTAEAAVRLGCDVAADLLRALAGERPVNLANPEVWGKQR